MSTVYGVSNIRNIFKEKLKMEEFVYDKTGVKTVEIINAAFFANQPTIFGTVNEDYVKRELDWYKSMSLNVNEFQVVRQRFGRWLHLQQVVSTQTMVGASTHSKMVHNLIM